MTPWPVMARYWCTIKIFNKINYLIKMNDTIETPPSPYWMLQFIVKHGDWIAIACGALPLLASVVCVVVCAITPWIVIAGAVGSVFLFVLMRAFVELVRVIVDMLLPK